LQLWGLDHPEHTVWWRKGCYFQASRGLELWLHDEHPLDWFQLRYCISQRPGRNTVAFLQLQQLERINNKF